ncbi:prepilin-type N-terminal cleavage/methylation domain-containing protein [Polaromonas sp. YR568]|uniref:type II secretion system protein n=1 Tax=Polaromonas sp. YR568 TaxID=1855301 RepID=UPI003137AAF6
MTNEAKKMILRLLESRIPLKAEGLSPSPKIRQRGFSLIEIALVLVIAGLALGAGLAALGPQLINKRFSDTQRQLQDASEAIVAFAMVNRRLPCPATLTSNGLESFCTNAAGGCGGAEVVPPATSAGQERGRCFTTANPNTANGGFLPAATLGLPGQRAVDGLVVDSWARPLRYVVPTTTNTTVNNGSVTLSFSVPVGSTQCAGGASTCYPFTHSDGIRNAYYNPTIDTVSDIFICNALGNPNCAGAGARQLANPAFLVFSTGANLNAAPPALSVDEAANTDNNRIFVLHERIEATTPVNLYFDDLIAWVTGAQLTQRMQANGVLP